jgi:anti-sigma B factor antagonist
VESAAPLTVRVESGNGSATIALNGELDIQTVPVLEDHLAQVEAGDVSEITLDLSDVTFLDTTALHAFVAARDRAKEHGRRLILVGVGPPARRLLDLTDTQYLLHGDP